MKNVMVDLETLGNGSQSVLLSIGAVEFDSTGLGRTLYVNVDPQSCEKAGLKTDTSTVLWWMQQSDEARSVFKAKGVSLEEALASFSDWFPKDATLWGNGATFDNVILDNAYKAIGASRPWHYTKDRCYRTLKALHRDVVADETSGVHHNALDDAVYQARHAVKIFNEAYK